MISRCSSGVAAATTRPSELRPSLAPAQSVMIIVGNFLRGVAANDNAVKAAKVAGFALISAGCVFGSIKEAKAAERIVKTGIMMEGDAAFDPTWLLRPNKFSGPIPAEFGGMVEVAKYGLFRIGTPDEPAFPAKMRLIAKVTFS